MLSGAALFQRSALRRSALRRSALRRSSAPHFQCSVLAVSSTQHFLALDDFLALGPSGARHLRRSAISHACLCVGVCACLSFISASVLDLCLLTYSPAARPLRCSPPSSAPLHWRSGALTTATLHCSCDEHRSPNARKLRLFQPLRRSATSAPRRSTALALNRPWRSAVLVLDAPWRFAALARSSCDGAQSHWCSASLALVHYGSPRSPGRWRVLCA